MTAALHLSPLLLVAALAALAGIGLISGFLGIGGGVLIIPLLTLLAVQAGLEEELAVNQAMGTTLAISSLTALSGFLVHRRKVPAGPSPWPLAASVAFSAFFGGLVGARLGPALFPLFGVGAILAGLAFALRREHGRDDPLPGGVAGVLLGIPIGFCAALIGLGGAIFTGLVFSGILGFPIRRVAATTSLAQVCGAAMGCLGWVVGGLGVAGLVAGSVGYVHVPTALVALLVTWPTARLGARMTHRTPPLWARLAFAAILLVIAARYLTR